jgi:hypothetical protein
LYFNPIPHIISFIPIWGGEGGRGAILQEVKSTYDGRVGCVAGVTDCGGWVFSDFRSERKIAKSDYSLRHICPSLRPHGKTRFELSDFFFKTLSRKFKFD